MTAHTLATLLGNLKPRRVERALQDAIAAKLAAHGVEFCREHRLDPQNRLDFYLVTADGQRVCIEIKVRGASSPDTERQLLRYALTKQIDHIIVVTTKFLPLRRAFVVGERIVPVQVINLEMNFL